MRTTATTTTSGVIERPCAVPARLASGRSRGIVHVQLRGRESTGPGAQDAVAKPLPDFAQQVLFQPVGITSVVEEPGAEHGQCRLGHQDDCDRSAALRSLPLQKGRSANQQSRARIVDRRRHDAAVQLARPIRAQRGTTYGYLWWLAEPRRPLQLLLGATAVSSVCRAVAGHGRRGDYAVAGISAEVNPVTFAGNVLTVIVTDVLPAAR